MDPNLALLLLQPHNQWMWQIMAARMQYFIDAQNIVLQKAPNQVKEEQSVATKVKSPSSPSSTPITLWQFLLELLDSGDHNDIITWTNAEGEFKFIDAEAVARMWGDRKSKNGMNYDKMSRGLRFYYEKNIIQKVKRASFTYRFVGYPDHIGQTSSSPASVSSPSSSSTCSSNGDTVPDLSSTLDSPTTITTRPSFCIKSILEKAEKSAKANATEDSPISLLKQEWSS